MDENFWSTRRVLVTGASGFVGRQLAKKLIGLGAYIGITHLDNIAHLGGSSIFRCNVANYADVNRAVSRFQPDIVFHLAAQPIVDVALNNAFDTLETNIRGTYNLLEVCARTHSIQHFIHFSTDKVYGETTDENGSTELSNLGGVGHPYNASKLCGDILAQSYQSFTDLPISIIRSGNIYGEGDTHFERLIPYVCRMLVEGKPLRLRSNGFLYRDYIYIDDVIDALLLVGQERYNQNSVYNLGAESYTVREIVSKLITIHGKYEGDIPAYEDVAQLELTYQHMNYDKIKAELGWYPKADIDTGLKKAYDWYKDRYE